MKKVMVTNSHGYCIIVNENEVVRKYTIIPTDIAPTQILIPGMVWRAIDGKFQMVTDPRGNYIYRGEKYNNSELIPLPIGAIKVK